jgi:hypothetical protein
MPEVIDLLRRPETRQHHWGPRMHGATKSQIGMLRNQVFMAMLQSRPGIEPDQLTPFYTRGNPDPSSPCEILRHATKHVRPYPPDMRGWCHLVNDLHASRCFRAVAVLVAASLTHSREASVDATSTLLRGRMASCRELSASITQHDKNVTCHL